MSFTFFTFGGMQLWEDIFYYQKWRIQRNCITNRCRLLDDKDIRRTNGTLEECQKEFARFREIFELPPQNGHMIILLHGLGGTKRRFAKMIEGMKIANLNAVAINYPSTRKGLKNISRQLDIFLNSLEGINRISFITHGIGGVILRDALNTESPWRYKMNIGRVVQINPPNRENRVWSRLKEYSFFRKILGPLINEYESKNLAKIPGFPSGVEFGILCTHNPVFDNLAMILPKSWQKLLPQKEDAFLTGTKDAINIKVWSINSCASQKAIISCIRFIKRGNFGT